MLRSALSKVMWVGRATVFLVGLAVILALLFGVVSRAMAHSGVDTKLFHLGHPNSATNMTSLRSSVGDALKSTLLLNNTGGTSALDLRVTDPDTHDPTLKDVAPMKVDSQAKVDNFNADELDGKNSSEFVQGNGITKRGQADVAFGDFPLILSITGPDVEVRFACEQASPGWNVTNKSGSESVNLFVDRGGADPESFLLAPSGQTIGLSGDQVGIPSTPGGDHLTFQAQSATGTATIEAFSGNSASGCHAQAQALATR